MTVSFSFYLLIYDKTDQTIYFIFALKKRNLLLFNSLKKYRKCISKNIVTISLFNAICTDKLISLKMVAKGNQNEGNFFLKV